MKARDREELLRQVARAISTIEYKGTELNHMTRECPLRYKAAATEAIREAEAVIEANLPQLAAGSFRMLIPVSTNLDRLVVFTETDGRWTYETRLEGHIHTPWGRNYY